MTEMENASPKVMVKHMEDALHAGGIQVQVEWSSILEGAEITFDKDHRYLAPWRGNNIRFLMDILSVVAIRYKPV